MFGEIRACLKQGTFDFILSAICNQISNIWLTVSHSYIKSHIAFNIIRKISKKWDCAYSMPGSISQDYTRCLFMQSLSGRMRQLVRAAPSETGNQRWRAGHSVPSWYCLQIYSCACTTQRNNIREDKAKPKWSPWILVKWYLAAGLLCKSPAAERKQDPPVPLSLLGLCPTRPPQSPNSGLGEHTMRSMF